LIEEDDDEKITLKKILYESLTKSVGQLAKLNDTNLQ
jgi:hypothetical protein